MPWRLIPILPVLLGVACAQVALGLSTPLIPLLLLQNGAQSPLIGAVASCYFVGFLAGALLAPVAVRRVGHVRAFALFAAICADCALLMAFGHTALAIGALRLATGFASSALFLIAESWLNDHADSGNRGGVFSAYLVTSWGATAAGPLVLNVIPASPLLFVLVGLAFATAVVPMAATIQPNPPVPPAQRLSPWALARISPLGLACAGVAGMVNSAFYALVPVYLQRHGQGGGAVAAVSSLALIAALSIQVPVGLLSDRYGRRRLTLATLAVAVAAAGVLALVGWPGLWAMAALAMVYAAATAPLYGLGAGQTNDRMARGDYVAASGGLLFTWALGASFGPGFAGAAMGILGPAGLFAFLAGVLTLMAAFTVSRMLGRPEVPRDRRAPFVPTPAPPRQTSVAARNGDG